MKKLLVLAGLLVLGGSLAVALASSDSEDASPSGSFSPQTRPSAYMSPIESRGSSPARLGGDDRYFGYVRAVDAKADPPTISFDVAQFFFGKDVQKAAEEAGAVAPGEPVSNDHYERNADTEARALKVADDAQVTASRVASRLAVPPEARARCRYGCADAIPVGLADFFSSFEPRPQWSGIPVWVTFRDGLVVRIDEQYFP